MYKQTGLWINHQWRNASNGDTVPIINPATEDIIGHVASATIEDTQEAIVAAATALAVWRNETGFARADALHMVANEMHRRSEDAARIITLETGKPKAQSLREWGLCCDQFRWYAEEARRIYGRVIHSRVPGGKIEVLHEPVGVVAAFTAWNFPAVLVARKIAPALAAGCSVIVRPSSKTPGSAMIICECIAAIKELPAGVVNLLCGSTKNTYEPLMASPIIRKVSLTGSTRVGQQMIRDAALTVKRTSMELGGNAPLIIFDDADIDAAITATAAIKFANAGQVCVSPDRFFVHRSVYDAFVEKFQQRAKQLKLGNASTDDSVDMGPLISSARLEETLAVIKDAKAHGAEIVTGGRRAPNFDKGYFIEPTVITGMKDDVKVFAEENFAPIAAIVPFDSDDDVYQRIASTPHGLAAYAFTRSPVRMREAVGRIASGMVGINGFALAAAEAPFGGIGLSGMGREGGIEGLHDYLNIKMSHTTVY